MSPSSTCDWWKTWQNAKETWKIKVSFSFFILFLVWFIHFSCFPLSFFFLFLIGRSRCVKSVRSIHPSTHENQLISASCARSGEKRGRNPALGFIKSTDFIVGFLFILSLYFPILLTESNKNKVKQPKTFHYRPIWNLFFFLLLCYYYRHGPQSDLGI